jgi:hypothetical protein
MGGRGWGTWLICVMFVGRVIIRELEESRGWGGVDCFPS